MMSKRYMLFWGFLLMSLYNFCGVNETWSSVDPKDVSLVQLIANPNEYHGKVVRLIGFCRLEFEGDALYLHREDFEQGITKNAVWLDVEQTVRVQDLSDRYVLVEAVFDAEDKGHMDLFSGSLKHVKRMESWRSRKESERVQGSASQP